MTPDHDCGRAGVPHAIFCSPLDPTATPAPKDTGDLRYSWMKGIATAPSPTAEPTRLVEPERTSPAAKTPGMLVSNRVGGRSRGQSAASVFTSAPVRMKPLASR